MINERQSTDSISLGMYVTFIAGIGIYRVEEEANINAWMLDGDPTERRWILKQTHELDKGILNEVKHKYYMEYNPSFYLIQTKETIALNRESKLKEILDIC